MEEITIRSAALSDAPRLLEIYGWYVEHTAISFEYETPSLAEFTQRIAHTLERYPASSVTLTPGRSSGGALMTGRQSSRSIWTRRAAASDLGGGSMPRWRTRCAKWAF